MKLKFKPNLGAAKDRKGSSRGGGGGRQQGLVAGSRGGGGRKRGPSTSCEESTGEESGTDYDREIEQRETIESTTRIPKAVEVPIGQHRLPSSESETNTRPSEQQLHTSEEERMLLSDQSTRPGESSPTRGGHGTARAQLTRKPVSLTGEQKGSAGRLRRRKVAPTIAPRRRGQTTAVSSGEDPCGKSSRDDVLTETPTQSSDIVDVQTAVPGDHGSSLVPEESDRSESSGGSSFGMRLRRRHQSQSLDQNTDEIISNTLSEVLDNAHTSGQFAPGDTNLSSIVRSSLDLICPPPEGEEDLIVDSRQEGHDRNGEGFGYATDFNTEQSSEGSRRGVDFEPESCSGAGRRLRTDSQSSEVVDGGQSSSPRRTKGKSRRNSGTKRRRSTSDDMTSPAQTKRARSSSSLRTTRIREAPDRSTMTMQELIYYNPSANPMTSSVEETRRKQKEGEEGEDTTRELDSNRSSSSPDGQSSQQEPPLPLEDEVRLVPQLRIAEDGTITVDEESMVMETTQRMAADTGEPVVECISHTTSNSFRKSYRVTKWTKKETSQFFTALRQVGTDFTMMTLLMPKRSRKELKNKFKKEEKYNPHLVSQALKNQVSLQRLQQ